MGIIDARFIQNLYRSSANYEQKKILCPKMSNSEQPFDRFKHALFPYAPLMFLCGEKLYSN